MQKGRFMSFDTWIADTCDESRFCAVQVFRGYFSAFLCVLCVFAVKILVFRFH